jgi:hypothetical protein
LNRSRFQTAIRANIGFAGILDINAFKIFLPVKLPGLQTAGTFGAFYFVHNLFNPLWETLE